MTRQWVDVAEPRPLSMLQYVSGQGGADVVIRAGIMPRPDHQTILVEQPHYHGQARLSPDETRDFARRLWRMADLAEAT
jgi:hypothetical protein